MGHDMKTDAVVWISRASSTEGRCVVTQVVFLGHPPLTAENGSSACVFSLGGQALTAEWGHESLMTPKLQAEKEYSPRDPWHGRDLPGLWSRAADLLVSTRCSSCTHRVLLKIAVHNEQSACSRKSPLDFISHVTNYGMFQVVSVYTFLPFWEIRLIFHPVMCVKNKLSWSLCTEEGNPKRNTLSAFPSLLKGLYIWVTTKERLL